MGDATKIFYVVGALAGLACGVWLALILPQPNAPARPDRRTAEHAEV